MDTKAIVFDLGKVLIDFDAQRACAQISNVTGVSQGEISHFLFDSGWEHRFESGEFGFATLHSAFETYFKTKASISALRRAAAEIFTPIQENLELLETLRATHRDRTPLILLSNTNEIHWEYIESMWNISSYFDHLVLSFEVRRMKPDPEIYKHVFLKTGLAAHECFFVDDVPANVSGARSVGMDAVLFESPIQLQHELRARRLI